MRRFSFLLLVAPLAVFLVFFHINRAKAQAEQEQAQLQHEVKVTLKLIQVYVTDKKGNPVLDLGKDHFTVYDNGQRQRLTEFEKHVLSLPSGKNKSKNEELTETQTRPGRELMGRKFILFFDFAYNNAKGILKAREAALRFIDTQVVPQDELAVLSYSAMKSLKLHEYLTIDHKKVREAVKGFGVEQVIGRAENFEEEYWRSMAGEAPLDASESSPAGSEFSQKARLADESKVQIMNFGRKLGDLAKAFRYIPGHKNIILFSSGVPYSLLYGIQAPFGSTQREAAEVATAMSASNSSKFGSWGESVLRQVFEDMLKEMGSANCAIYALDTMELGSGIKTDTRTLGVFSLQKMTSATGGKYFGNINKYEQHLDKIQNLTGCYYVLGYYVDDKWDGTYHNIKVEVTEPGLEVHAQKGYFNPKPFTEYNDMEKILHLVDLALSEEPLFQTPVRFPLDVVPCPAGAKGNLCLVAKIPVEKIRDVLAGKSEFVAVIFDDKENIVTLRRNEKKTYTLTGELFSFGAAFSLSPGKYQCRLVIRNLETGRGAVASCAVFIPGE